MARVVKPLPEHPKLEAALVVEAGMASQGARMVAETQAAGDAEGAVAETPRPMAAPVVEVEQSPCLHSAMRRPRPVAASVVEEALDWPALV